MIHISILITRNEEKFYNQNNLNDQFTNFTQQRDELLPNILSQNHSIYNIWIRLKFTYDKCFFQESMAIIPWWPARGVHSSPPCMEVFGAGCWWASARLEASQGVRFSGTLRGFHRRHWSFYFMFFSTSTPTWWNTESIIIYSILSLIV